MPQTFARSRPFRLLVWGEYALFTRPEMKVERVSYEIMTPAAARGVLESILWKPQMRWIIERIDRLKPVHFVQVRRNEVSVKASPKRLAIFVDDPDVRVQRAAVVLKDPKYTIHAHIALSEMAGPEDTLAKYVDMFVRRAQAGQCFQRPCLGAREFAAHFRLLGDDQADVAFEGQTAPEEKVGRIFYDYDRRQVPWVARFFEPTIERGRMIVPPPESVGVLA